MSDALIDGRRIRPLPIVDSFSRESLAIQVAASIRGQDVVDVLQFHKEQRGLHRVTRVDNRTEFTSKRLNQWIFLNYIELDFSRPSKTRDNACMESFTGRFRQECLNESWRLPLDDNTESVEKRRTYYNWEWPPSQLRICTLRNSPT